MTTKQELQEQAYCEAVKESEENYKKGLKNCVASIETFRKTIERQEKIIAELKPFLVNPADFGLSEQTG